MAMTVDREKYWTKQCKVSLCRSGGPFQAASVLVCLQTAHATISHSTYDTSVWGFKSTNVTKMSSVQSQNCSFGELIRMKFISGSILIVTFLPLFRRWQIRGVAHRILFVGKIFRFHAFILLLGRNGLFPDVLRVLFDRPEGRFE